MNLAIFIFLVIVSFSCFLQGIVGFGSALIIVPLALVLFDKATVVSSMLITGIAFNYFMIRKIKTKVDHSLITILFIASLLGMMIGVVVFKLISTNLLQLTVGILAISFVLIYGLLNFNLPKSNLLTLLAGFFSGILNTSTSLSGPPVAILLLTQKREKKDFRKTLAIFFLLMNLVSVLLFIFNKIFTERGVILGFLSIPFVLIGGYLGDRVSNRISQKKFKILILILIFLTGLYGIYSSFLQ
jgi:uncharacterized membrane protein YfcA